MTYVPNVAQDRRKHAAVRPYSPPYAATFSYIIFALAFVFTGAVVFGLIH